MEIRQLTLEHQWKGYREEIKKKEIFYETNKNGNNIPKPMRY